MRLLKRAAVLALFVAVSAPQLSAQWAEQARVGMHPASARLQNEAGHLDIAPPRQEKSAGGRSKVGGAIAGAMLGFLAGGALGYGIERLACGDDTECWGDSHGMHGMIVGATLGTIVGIPIGIRIASRGAKREAYASMQPSWQNDTTPKPLHGTGVRPTARPF